MSLSRVRGRVMSRLCGRADKRKANQFRDGVYKRNGQCVVNASAFAFFHYLMSLVCFIACCLVEKMLQVVTSFAGYNLSKVTIVLSRQNSN